MNRRERRKQRIARQRAASVTSASPDTSSSHDQAPPSPSQEVSSRAGDLALHPDASTGPRTEAGKAVASRNAVKHNLCSKRLTGSDLDELNAIRAKLEHEWEPGTETERMLLDQMALSQWRMDRALSLELAALDDAQIDQPLLALALRYRTAAERSFYKALAELQRLRAAIREDAIRQLKQEKENEAAIHREMQRLCFAPIAGAYQFVSQNAQPTASAPPQPDYDALRAYLNAQIGSPKTNAAEQ
jgi:hypothetical protein